MTIERFSAIERALNTAAHPATSAIDKASAIRGANMLLKKHGISVSAIDLPTEDVPTSTTPYATLRRIEQLEADLADCRLKGRQLQADNENLRSTRATQDAKIATLRDQLRDARASQPQAQPNQAAEIARLKKELAEETEHADDWQSAHAERKRERDQALSDLRQERKSHTATEQRLTAILARATKRADDWQAAHDDLTAILASATKRADDYQMERDDVARQRDQALRDLRQERKSHVATQRGLAAIKAQPVPSGPTIQQLQHLIEEKHRIIQYLSRILDKDLFERLVDQGRNHANKKPLKKITWPTNPDEILGDFEWGTRGKPKKAKPY